MLASKNAVLVLWMWLFCSVVGRYYKVFNSFYYYYFKFLNWKKGFMMFRFLGFGSVKIIWIRNTDTCFFKTMKNRKTYQNRCVLVETCANILQFLGSPWWTRQSGFSGQRRRRLWLRIYSCIDSKKWSTCVQEPDTHLGQAKLKLGPIKELDDASFLFTTWLASCAFLFMLLYL